MTRARVDVVREHGAWNTEHRRLHQHEEQRRTSRPSAPSTPAP
jgi:hypothetical protein